MTAFTTLIDTTQLQRHLSDPLWRIIDCRFSLADTEAGRRAYQEGHIPGAVYAHLDEDLSGTLIPGKTGRHPLPSVEEATRTFSRWGIAVDTQVVAYDDMSGAIAARLWWLLRWLGHDRVAVLDGGWTRWQEEGRPVEEALSAIDPAEFVAHPRAGRWVDAAFVEEIRKDSGYRLIDSRTAERYRGDEEPIDPVAGHIPGAVNAPHPEVTHPDGSWLTPVEMRRRFEEILADTPTDRAVFYCGSGVTACRNLLALAHSGLGEGVLYAGSWSDWITDSERKVESGSSTH